VIGRAISCGPLSSIECESHGGNKLFHAPNASQRVKLRDAPTSTRAWLNFEQSGAPPDSA
jgi:hypothetical protein